MSEFMVMLRGNDPEKKRIKAAEAKRLMQRYGDWVAKLKQENRYRGGSPFKEGTRLLSGHRNMVCIMNGPHGEGFTGYFVISAGCLNEAIEIAKTCPALSHGETVEVLALNN